MFGYLHGHQIICMQGRFHLYEGYPPQTCVIPIRVMKLFGVQRLVLTNAAGGLNKDVSKIDQTIFFQFFFISLLFEQDLTCHNPFPFALGPTQIDPNLT